MPAPPTFRADLTRRQLLVVAGGVSVAALLHAAPPVGAAEPTPDAARLATLAALVAAVGAGPAGGVTDELVSAYVDRYAVYRATEASQELVAYADAALDEIGATGFGGLDPSSGLRQLERWAQDGEHAARAAAALDLTRLAFGEDEARQAGYSLARSAS